MQRPFALWPLAICLLFLSLGGLYGGIAMLIDPTGGSLELTEKRPLLPLSDYILPGIFLLVVMGLAPLLLTYGCWPAQSGDGPGDCLTGADITGPGPGRSGSA